MSKIQELLSEAKTVPANGAMVCDGLYFDRVLTIEEMAELNRYWASQLQAARMGSK